MANGLKEKPKQTVRIIAIIAAILWAALIFWLSSIPGADYPQHPSFLNIVAHLCLYLVLAVFLALAFNSPKRALWKTALLALVIAALYGVSDEFHQLFTPGRSSDPFGTGSPFDLIIDTIGALVGAAATIWFLSARKVAKSRNRDKELGEKTTKSR
jgi:VanZ family protein